MDAALPPSDHALIESVLDDYRTRHGIRFHALRTRDAGARRFVAVHVLVPGSWTVQAGHDLLERLEADISGKLGGAEVFTHLEPVEDPTSWADGGDHPEGPLTGPGRPGGR